MLTDAISLASTAVGSSALTAVITKWLDRKKSGAEATEILVRSALQIEKQATERYTSAAEALEAAQAALTTARLEIGGLEDYIVQLHELLDEAGIEYPERPTVYVEG